MSTETPTVTNEPVEYYTPDVEIFEDNEALTVTADLPGVAPENLEVSLDAGNLTLTGASRPPRTVARPAPIGGVSS
jgi:HSP20 family protein